MADVAVNQVKCKVSASLLINNLSSSEGYLSYVHRSEVHLVKNAHASLISTEKAGSLSAKSAYAEKDPVSQAKLCKLSALGDLLVVITSTGLVHLYDDSGQKLLHFHKLTSAKPQELFLRGIGHDGLSTLVVGSGAGEVLVFSLAGKKLSLAKKLQAHAMPITDVDLNSKDALLAVSDELGGISLWDGKDSKDGSFSKLTEFKANGDPCWSLQLAQGFVIGAFASGHLRLYSLEKRALAVEIAAHTRQITALAVHPTLPLVAACSEDSFF